jgi:hypothetical protein
MEAMHASRASIERELRGRTEEDWLVWLLDFAQADISHWHTREYRQCGRRLKAFLLAHGFGLSYTPKPMRGRHPDGSPRVGPMGAALPSAQDIWSAQEQLRSTLTAIAMGEPRLLIEAQLRYELHPTANGPMLMVIEEGHETPYNLPFPRTIGFHFARLIDRISRSTQEQTQGKGPTRLKQCQAPIPRRSTVCGTWFLGRPKQWYCSMRCQSRAASRRFRQQTTGATA